MFGQAYHNVIVDIEETLGSRMQNPPATQVAFEKLVES